MKRILCAAALLVTAMPFVAPIQAHAANVTITSGTIAIGQGARGAFVTIDGTGFQSGAVAKISGTKAFLPSPEVFSPTAMFVFATVAHDAATGTRSLTITNPDGSSATCLCVTIDPAPAVTSIDSLEAGAGQVASFPEMVGVHGTGFISGFDGKAFIHGSGVAAWPDLQVVSSTEAMVGVVTAPSAAPGRYDVTFTNGDGGVGRCVACFRILPGPSVTSMTPNAFVRGHSYTVTLSGRHFDQGALPFVFDLHGGITVSHVVVNATGTSITFHMTISRKAYLNFPFIWLHVRNPAPGFGSIDPMQLTVVKSCGSTTC